MRQRIKDYITSWITKCYSSDIPDEVPAEIFDRAPSYKRICIAIMKNDTQLEILGFSRKKCKIYSLLKRAEIKERGIKDPQLKIFE